MTLRPVLLALVSIALLSTAGIAVADIVADFDDGNTSAAVDGYPGTAGDGWLDGWTQHADTGTPIVTTANPIGSAGDPYLSVQPSGDTPMVRREFGTFGTVDLTKQHTIEWKWRFDGNPADFGGSFSDRIHFFADTDPENGSNAGNSWLIGLIAADRAGNDIHDGHWYFYDRTDGGFNTANMVDTGMTLQPGAVYDFKVTVAPDRGRYDVTISDGTTAVTGDQLFFRNNLTSAGGYLHFGTNASSASDDLSFALDSIRVSRAVIQADFTHGNGNTAADQVVGKAGQGWIGAWTFRDTSAVTTDFSAVTPADAGFSEVAPGAGPYLSARFDNITDGNGYGAVSRQHTQFSVLDPTQPHTVQFQVRIDESQFSTFVNADWDQYFMFDGESADSSYASSTLAFRTPTSWLVLASGGALGGVPTKHWAFYNGARDDGNFDPSLLVDSGVEIVPGGTYNFAVQIDPATGTYNVAIADGADGRVVTGLGFQKSAANVGRWLHFGGRSNRVEDVREFSLDLLRVDTPVSEVVANFADGAGAEYVDQVGGRPGDGWVTPWQTTNANIVPALGTENPLMPGSGDYLTATVLPGGGTSLARMYLGEFDPTAPQQVSWQYRHDAPLDEFADTDRIHFFEDARALSGSSGSNRWLIFADGRDRGDVPPGYWILFDPSQSGDDRYIDTGIPLAEDHVYTFAVDMDPVAGLWDAVVRDETAGLVFSNDSPLGFRTSARTAGGYLNFGAVLNAGRTPIQFSLDSIRVSDEFLDFGAAVPEPSSLALAALGLLGFATLVRRRRR